MTNDFSPGLQAPGSLTWQRSASDATAFGCPDSESPLLCLGNFSPPSLGGRWSLPSMRVAEPLATQPPFLWGVAWGYAQQSDVKTPDSE